MTYHDDHYPYQRCELCDHYNEVLQECRRRSPTGNSPDGKPLHPRCTRQHWCGDFGNRGDCFGRDRELEKP